jgi:hypothetical protein
LGTGIAGIREAIRACWDAADNGRSFMTALAAHGLVLARGERCDFVIVDHAGGLHALSKRITGATAAEIRTRLADLDPATLPTVSQAKTQQAESPPLDIRNGALTVQPSAVPPVPVKHGGGKASSSEMANSIGIPPRALSASPAPAIIADTPTAPEAAEQPEAAAASDVPERQRAASAASASAPAARKSWKLAARKLVKREPAAPKPRRRRRRGDARGDAHGMFRAAAKITLRQAVEFLTAGRAGAFLSDTLDWLNLWDNAGQANDDLPYSDNAHLSPRL